MGTEREVTAAMLATEATRKYYGVSLWTEPDRARAWLHKLKGAPYFMSNRAIARRAGLCESNLSQIIKGNRGQGREYEPVKSIHRDTEAAILGVQPVINPPKRGGGWVEPTGARRRLQALIAAGFPIKYLSEGMGWGVDPQPVHRFVTGKSGAKYVQHSTHLKAVALYDKLSECRPEDMGFTAYAISRARKAGEGHDWATPIAWDTDTIDDPDAFPEWTGECGSVSGYNLHRKHGIRMVGNSVRCAACCNARTAEKRATEDRLAARRGEAEQYLREGKAMRWIADELGMSTRTVQRVKRDMDNDKE